MGSGLLDNLNAIKSSEPDPIDPTPLIPIDPFLSEDHFLSIFCRYSVYIDCVFQSD